MPRVVHFEFAVDNPERAGAFYQNVFNWKVQKWDGPEDYWLLATGEGRGIDGALMRRSEQMPNVVNIMDVSSVDDTVAKIEASGGKVVAPKMAVPGIGYVAYCQDTEGNTLGIMQDDPNAS